MSVKNKLVAIIGAGPSGLTCIKTCLEEGFEPICFEKTSDIGGLWKFREDNAEGVSSVMRSTIINSSKELTAFSDYPPPDHLPNFMHNRDLVEYFERYADHFNLLPYIRTCSDVTEIRKDERFTETGEWIVCTKDTKTDQTTSIKVGFVLVCVGHHSFPYRPSFPGMDDFEGTVGHTHEHKDSTGYLNHRTLVVGIGNSGGDAAVEVSRVCKKVYLSTRRGTWVQNRVGYNGTPIDIIFMRRIIIYLMEKLPISVVQGLMKYMMNSRFNHELYNLKPKHDPGSQHVMINDELPNRIISGTVVIKNNVHRFTKNGVMFKGEEDTEYPLDSVILATGYDIRFPFLDQSIVPVRKNQVTVYKYVFPPHLEQPTLALIGLIQPVGSIMPISEIQARWAVQVFAGKFKLPSEKDMLADIRRVRDMMRMRYTESQRHTIQVDYIPYTDEIASQIGAKPSLLRLAFTDPKLFYHVAFGPCASYQLRLQGPHPWKGAREAILTVDKRVKAPFQTRLGDDKTYSSRSLTKIFLFTILLVGIGYGVPSVRNSIKTVLSLGLSQVFKTIQSFVAQKI